MSKTYQVKVKYPSGGAELIYETDSICAAKRMLDQQNKRTDIERAFVCNAESGIEIEWKPVAHRNDLAEAVCVARDRAEMANTHYDRACGPVKG